MKNDQRQRVYVDNGFFGWNGLGNIVIQQHSCNSTVDAQSKLTDPTFLGLLLGYISRDHRNPLTEVTSSFFVMLPANHFI